MLFKADTGFVTFAQNNERTDYLRMAYIQALSAKIFMPQIPYAVIIDKETNSQMLYKYKKVFDYVEVLNDDDAKFQDWKMNNEYKLYWVTPFRETIKLEADMVFTRDISHWLNGMRTNEVLLTTTVTNYRNENVFKSPYRQQFLENSLPSVYNGFSYFRNSGLMLRFFETCKHITNNWNQMSEKILKGRFEQLTTDILYGLAAKLVGENSCTNNVLEYPKFVHMKGGIYGESSNDDWTKRFYYEIDDNARLRVGFTNQVYPFHYYQKHWITDELEEKYERCYRRIFKGY